MIDLQHVNRLIERAAAENERCKAANTAGDEAAFWEAQEAFMRLAHEINAALGRKETLQ